MAGAHRIIHKRITMNYYPFFGILLGVKKRNHIHTFEMWAADGTAPEYFKSVMTERRFHTLWRAIRFDKKATREQRKREDNLAPIREAFDEFVTKCKT